MGTCCSYLPGAAESCPEICLDGHNKSTPIFEEKTEKDSPRKGKVEAKSIEPKKCPPKPKNKLNNHRLSSIERPSQLKLARGQTPKVKIDDEKILRSIRMKMLLCSEVALIGTGGKTGNSKKLAPKSNSNGKTIVDLKKSPGKHKGSKAKITGKSLVCEAVKSTGFSVEKSSKSSSTTTQVDDEV